MRDKTKVLVSFIAIILVVGVVVSVFFIKDSQGEEITCLNNPSTFGTLCYYVNLSEQSCVTSIECSGASPHSSIICGAIVLPQSNLSTPYSKWYNNPINGIEGFCFNIDKYLPNGGYFISINEEGVGKFSSFDVDRQRLILE